VRSPEVGVYIKDDNMIISLKTNYILFPRKMYNDNTEELSLEKSKQEAINMLDMAKLLEDSINGSIENNFINRTREGTI